MDNDIEKRKEPIFGCGSMLFIGFILMFGLVLFFYELPELINTINSERINENFTIRYMDSHKSKCIYNGT